MQRKIFLQTKFLVLKSRISKVKNSCCFGNQNGPNFPFQNVNLLAQKRLRVVLKIKMRKTILSSFGLQDCLIITPNLFNTHDPQKFAPKYVTGHNLLMSSLASSRFVLTIIVKLGNFLQ